MGEIAGNLAEISERIAMACRRVQRDPASVELIAVSKTFPAEAVREAHAAGQVVFGESKLQEAESKIAALPAELCWHFIGRIQRNKLRKILTRFAVLHAVDSLRLAVYLNELAGELGMRPRIFLQVNAAGEASKGGFEPAELRHAIGELLALPRVEIIGLMCIPPAAADAGAARPWFAALRALRDELAAATGAPLPCLSMGMSGDYEVAIEEGATHVRVGSAIFGTRAYQMDDGQD